MNCKEFRRLMGEYVNGALNCEQLECAETHLKSCQTCAIEVHELMQTSSLLQGLNRFGAPDGFEERLKERIASQITFPRSKSFFGRLFEIFAGFPIRGHRMAIAGLAVFVLLIGSVFMVGQLGESDLDTAYLETCIIQHASFAEANPLADESAIILRERSRDLGEL